MKNESPEKIIKYYIDIGCVYEGDDTIANSYKDFQNWNTKKYGLIGVLKLRLDTVKRTKEEIFFKQIFSPYVHEFTKNLIYDLSCERSTNKEKCQDMLRIFREYRDADLVITWNGRDFDLPIILNNISFSKEYGEYCRNCINKKDRDLLDLCLLRDINIKGGLQEVVKRFKIFNLFEKNFPRYKDDEMFFLRSFDASTNKFNNYIKIAKHRNEFDVRALPLLEEKLGYLYEPRSCFDKFHKNWNKNK